MPCQAQAQCVPRTGQRTTPCSRFTSVGQWAFVSTTNELHRAANRPPGGSSCGFDGRGLPQVIGNASVLRETACSTPYLGWGVHAICRPWSRCPSPNSSISLRDGTDMTDFPFSQTLRSVAVALPRRSAVPHSLACEVEVVFAPDDTAHVHIKCTSDGRIKGNSLGVTPDTGKIGHLYRELNR